MVGIAWTKLNEALLFKGGTALKKIYLPDYRFSEDLDFTLVEKISIDEIEKEIKKAFEEILKKAGIKLLLREERTVENTYTLFANYTGPLEAEITKRDIKIDITRNERVVDKPEKRTLLREYDEYYDLPYDQKITVYSINEIFIEKVCCLLSPARNEPRDVYDLWSLLNYLGKSNAEMLLPEFKRKVKYKGLDKYNLESSIIKKEKQYEIAWGKRLNDQVNELPDYNRVYRELKKQLKQMGYFL
ncbi:nucleotidyl transferase AbiEii/AbiGii toxin family protein [Candidatus Margulisiibacteriota bacterium]